MKVSLGLCKPLDTTAIMYYIYIMERDYLTVTPSLQDIEEGWEVWAQEEFPAGTVTTTLDGEIVTRIPIEAPSRMTRDSWKRQFMARVLVRWNPKILG